MQTIRFYLTVSTVSPWCFAGFTTHEMGLAALPARVRVCSCLCRLSRLPAGLSFPPACWSCRCCSSGSAAAG